MALLWPYKKSEAVALMLASGNEKYSSDSLVFYSMSLTEWSIHSEIMV